MKKLKILENEVEVLLSKYQETRADDMLLYYFYCEFHGMKVEDAMRSLSRRVVSGVATYESVSRVRRLIQAKNERLRASEETIKARRALQKEYRKYARS